MRVVNVNRTFEKSKYVGRPSIYGNPFRLLNESQRDAVIAQFAEYWYAPEQKALRQRALSEISTQDTLGCHCAPKRCHADIIAGYVEWKSL